MAIPKQPPYRLDWGSIPVGDMELHSRLARFWSNADEMFQLLFKGVAQASATSAASSSGSQSGTGLSQSPASIAFGDDRDPEVHEFYYNIPRGSVFLANLVDVSIPSPVAGSVLTYNEATGKWVAIAPVSSGGTTGPTPPASCTPAAVAHPGGYFGAACHGERDFYACVWAINGAGVAGNRTEWAGPVTVAATNEAIQVTWPASTDPTAVKYQCAIGWSWYGIRATQIIETAGLTATFDHQAAFWDIAYGTDTTITSGAILADFPIPPVAPAGGGSTVVGNYAQLDAPNVFSEPNTFAKAYPETVTTTISESAVTVARDVSLVAAVPGGGTITWDTPATLDWSAGGDTSKTVATTVSSTSGFLIVTDAVWVGKVQSATGVTYNGVALSKLGTVSSNDANYTVDIWYLANPATGTHNTVVTWADAFTGEGLITATTYYGVNLSSPWGTPQTKSNTFGTNPFTFTYTTSPGDYIIETYYGSASNSGSSGQTTVGTHTAATFWWTKSYRQADSGGATTNTTWNVGSTGTYLAYLGCVLKVASNPTQTVTVTGPALDVKSNVPTVTNGVVTDSSPVAKLTQSYASASGPVLSIVNAGTGNAITAQGRIQATQFRGDGGDISGILAKMPLVVEAEEPEVPLYAPFSPSVLGAYVPYVGAIADLNLGAKNLFLTGSLGSTGVRVLKGWFTDVDITNPLPIASGGTAGATKAAAFDNLSPMTTLGDIIYGGTSGTGTRLGGNTASNTKWLSSTGTGSAAQAPSWQLLPVSGLSTYFFIDAASSIGGAYKQAVSINNYTAAAKANIATAGATTGTICGTFATNAGFPGLTIIPDGTFHLHIHAQRSAGGGTVTLSPQIYTRTAGGTETLILTLEEVGPLTTGEVEYDVGGVLSQPIAVNTTDRIVVKFSANVSVGTTTVTIYYDGTGVNETFSRLEMPAPATDVSNFVPYLGATTNVDLGTHSFYTRGDVGATGSRVNAAYIDNLTCTNTITGSISGNANTATTLQTARAINGQNFDGSAAITVPVNNANDTTNAAQYVVFTPTQGGNYAARTNAGLTFNPSVGELFVGANRTTGPVLMVGPNFVFQPYANNNQFFASNLYFDNPNWKYLTNNKGIAFQLFDDTFYVNTAPLNSGGAGATATVTTVFTVDGAGNTTAGGAFYERSRAAAIGVWAAYTPTWSAASGTAVSLGNGTITGAVMRIGKTTYYSITFNGGTTTTYGDAGNRWNFTLPDNTSANTYRSGGNGYTMGAYWWIVFPRIVDANNISGMVDTNTASGLLYVGQGTPYTWGTTNSLILSGWYEAA